jgi:hypothetical protein
MIFKDMHTNKQTDFLKLIFINSVLFHAKAFDDDLLMVVDLDEIPVSMNPTKTKFVEEFAAVTDENTCYIDIKPYIVWRIVDSSASKIGEMFPMRCAGGGMFRYHPKSAAVLKNANFVSIHEHGGCVNHSVKKSAKSTSLAFHHYTSFWGKVRNKCRYNSSAEMKSEIATFQGQ